VTHADPYRDRAPEPSAPGPQAGPADAEEAPAPAGQNGSEELARAEAERDQYLDALQRLKAEFDNYRKRTERDRQAVVEGAQREVVRGLLPVMDNLERAVAALGDRGGEILSGLEMVRGQLAGLLAGHGVQEIAAHGEAFDPNVHEAVAQVPSAEHAGGAVVEVIEKGYRISDHVLRPSRVVVAAGPPAPPPNGD
jgi:molecular chaperone GrpE